MPYGVAKEIRARPHSGTGRMPVISRVQGTPDSRKGWANPVPAGLTDHPWRATPVPHGNEIRAEKARREIEREAERKAANPDPRQALRDAHARRAETKAELDRIVGLRGRAADLVRALEQRHQQLTDEVRAGNKAAAAELVGALGQSRDDLPLSPQTEQLQAQLASVSGRLGVGRDAQAELSEQHRTAVAAVREAEAGVTRCAVTLAIDYSVGEAQEIEVLKVDLNRRRRDLWSLSAAITSQLRIMPHQAGLYLPAAVGRAIDNLDAAVDPAAAARLKRLTEDPEAEL